jgi:YebC/PmpR family DNA-binding regulatory protein
MAGHSKWANIKHKKAKEDAKKGKVFTKIVREITVAARDGGGDPATNIRLRLLVDKARHANMPADNVTRAIKKGTGELEGVAYESVTYEGYGPHGVAVIVEALTDNKNRAAADVRHVFTKHSGSMGSDGSVSWMFERKGVLTLSAHEKTEDELLELFLETNVEDIQFDPAHTRIICEPQELGAVRDAAEQAGLPLDTMQMEWVAKTHAAVDGSEAEEKVYQFLEKLDELDDVQHVFANIA